MGSKDGVINQKGTMVFMADGDLYDKIENANVDALAAQLGRQPTQVECFDFIFGDRETRLAIWNKGKEENN